MRPAASTVASQAPRGKSALPLRVSAVCFADGICVPNPPITSPAGFHRRTTPASSFTVSRRPDGSNPERCWCPRRRGSVSTPRPPAPPHLTSGWGQFRERLSPVVGDVHVAARVHGQVERPRELARTGAEGRHLAHELPRAGELLNPEVAGIADVDLAPRTDRDRALNQPEPSDRGPVASP